jgi:hypothetical protein
MWVMDRGIPSEETLREMRDPAREIFYLVGTPKGKIQQYEKKWLDLPWQKVRESVEVKLFEQEGELYGFAKSKGRQAKETAMRRKPSSRDQLLMRLGGREIGSRPCLPVHALASARGRPGGNAEDIAVSYGQEKTPRSGMA